MMMAYIGLLITGLGIAFFWLGIVIYRRIFIIGQYEAYEFIDKRTNHVTLHMKPSSIPTTPKQTIRLVKSFIRTLDYLHNNNYTQVSFCTHLLNERRIKALSRVLKKHGYFISHRFRLKTPRRHRRITFWTTLLYGGKKIKVADMSWDMTIRLR